MVPYRYTWLEFASPAYCLSTSVARFVLLPDGRSLSRVTGTMMHGENISMTRICNIDIVVNTASATVRVAILSEWSALRPMDIGTAQLHQ